jgi:hypothetical protein
MKVAKNGLVCHTLELSVGVEWKKISITDSWWVTISLLIFMNKKRQSYKYKIYNVFIKRNNLETVILYNRSRFVHALIQRLRSGDFKVSDFEPLISGSIILWTHINDSKYWILIPYIDCRVWNQFQKVSHAPIKTISVLPKKLGTVTCTDSQQDLPTHCMNWIHVGGLADTTRKRSIVIP